MYPYGSENRDDRVSFTGETCGYEFRSGESKQHSGPVGVTEGLILRWGRDSDGYEGRQNRQQTAGKLTRCEGD